MREFVTVVSGVPRSGTSLMMQVLEAGGIPLLTDEARPADEDNPKGYAEYAPVAASLRDVSWFGEAQGRAVKVIHTLLEALPSVGDLRIVLMERDLSEVARSQRKMLERVGGLPDDWDEARLAQIFAEQLREARRWAVERPRTALLQLEYRELLDDPARVAKRIDAFLGGGLDLEAMAKQPDPTLYRNR